MRTSSPAAFLVLCLVGCGGTAIPPDGSGNDAAAGGDSCSFTLSGAVTATSTCSVVAIYSASGNIDRGRVTIVPDLPVPSGTIAVLFSNGPPAVGTSSNTDQNASAQIAAFGPTLADGGSVASQWDTNVGTGGGGRTQGTYTVNLSSVRLRSMSVDGLVFDVHGTLNAVLEPASPGFEVGTVTVSVTF